MPYSNSHGSLKRAVGGTVVSMTLNKAGKKAIGNMVTPAIWLYDYQKSGKTPDTIDWGIFASGALSAPASFITGLVKSVVDDEIETKLKHVQSLEPKLYRSHIRTCYDYAAFPSKINAMKIAEQGGTAWHHPIGIWVYILDENGAYVADYKPVNPTIVYRPDLPLKKGLNNGYRWDTYRK